MYVDTYSKYIFTDTSFCNSYSKSQIQNDIKLLNLEIVKFLNKRNFMVPFQ